MRVATTLSLAGVLVAGTFVSTTSADIISGVTASASSFTPGREPILAVNGSGLSGALHDTNGNTLWESDYGSVSAAYFTSNLGATYTLDQLTLWNENGQRSRGVKQVNIYFTNDDTIGATAPSSAWGTPQSVTFTAAPGPTPGVFPWEDFYAGQNVALTPVSAKYVGFDIVSNHIELTVSEANPFGYEPYVGIGEIQFSGSSAPVPEPASLVVLGTVGLIGLRRRRHG